MPPKKIYNMTLPDAPMPAFINEKAKNVIVLAIQDELKSIQSLITNPAFVRKLKNVEAKRLRVLRRHGDHWKCFAHCKTAGCLECTEYFHNRQQLANIDPKGEDWVNHPFKTQIGKSHFF